MGLPAAAAQALFCNPGGASAFILRLVTPPGLKTVLRRLMATMQNDWGRLSDVYGRSESMFETIALPTGGRIVVHAANIDNPPT